MAFNANEETLMSSVDFPDMVLNQSDLRQHGTDAAQSMEVM